MSARQCEYERYRLKKKVSIDDVKGDIAATVSIKISG
jgi:hypothetical protein